MKECRLSTSPLEELEREGVLCAMRMRVCIGRDHERKEKKFTMGRMCANRTTKAYTNEI
jgi:hypothetical protein